MKKQILIVDRDSPDVAEVRQQLTRLGYDVALVEDGEQALELCRAELPDLVLADVFPPKGGGYRLLEEVKHRPEKQAVLVILWGDLKALEERIQWIESGADDFILKPFAPEEVVARVRMLLSEVESVEQARTKIERGFSGSLSEMNLIDLVQTLEVGKKTGVLKLKRDGQEGLVFVKEGQVVDASLNGWSAEQAILRMVTWIEGSFWVEMKELDRPKVVTLTNKDLINEGLRRITEWEQLRRQLPGPDAVLERGKPISKDELTPEDEKLLSLLNGVKTLREVVEESQMDEIEALRRIRDLYARGALREKPTPREIRGSSLRFTSRAPGKAKPVKESVFSFITSLFKRPAESPPPIRAERRREDRRKGEDRRRGDRRRDGAVRERNTIYLNKSELLLIREKLQ